MLGDWCHWQEAKLDDFCWAVLTGAPIVASKEIFQYARIDPKFRSRFKE